MPIIIAEIPEQSGKAAFNALTPLALPGSIKLLGLLATPSDNDDEELVKLAKKVVTVVRPKANQPLRQEALTKLLREHDTFKDQGGEADPALRNAFGAISKALKVIFPYDTKPITRLAIPKKTFFPDGTYRGTVYSLTALGEHVRDILKTDGVI